ncbi:MAG: DUF3786 domain-containing protein [bacterium]|nr:DUF3786 domain-containing protein [bacterium]
MFEKELWKKLIDISPQEISVNSRAVYDPVTKQICVNVFNEKFTVDLEKQIITSSAQGKVSPLLPLFLLHYLACSKDIPLCNTLASPHQLKGGIFFFRGAHELPLDKIAEKFGNDLEKFLEKGKKLGGEKVKFGDAAVKLNLLPRIPVIFIIWKKDEEFESQVNLILDKSVEEQMNLDILFLGLIYAIGKILEV